MDWIQVLAIIGSLGGFMFWIYSKIDSDVKTISNRLDQHITASSQRTDQLYQMFIDLLKEGKHG